MRYITLMLLLIFLVLGTVAYRALQVAGYPMGLGSFELSPNGFYEAHASNMIDKTFWGHETHYYEFQIVETRGRTIVKKYRMGYAPGLPAVTIRQDGMIHWNATSSQVTFGDAATTVWMTTVP